MRNQRLVSLAAFATALVSAFGVAFWATGPSFAAEFGPIDDHEPLRWMGPDGDLPWSELWRTFVDETEVGEWGSTSRFRPAYYLFRVGETALFGDNPWAWYACVLVMFAAACAVLGYTASLWLSVVVEGSRPWICWAVPIVGSAAGAFLFAGLYAWSGIVARLGPSELLGLVATAVVLLSLTKLSLGQSRGWWTPALAGVFTAIFAKESFFSLALVFPLVGTYAYLSFGRHKKDLVAGLLGLLPALLLALILAPTVLDTQRDVYGEDVGGGRLAGAVSAFAEHPLRRFFLAAGVVLLAWLALSATLSRAEQRVTTFLLAVTGWLFACVLLDAWFYGGEYSLPRYRAVTDLVIAVLVIGAACLSIVAVRRGRKQSRPMLVLAVASAVASSLVLVRLAQTSVWNLRVTHANASRQADTSNDYQRGLSEALARLAVKPNPTVAVVATNGGDYEPAFAVLNEVARRSESGFRQYLIVENASPGTNALLDTMTGISEQGASDWQTRPVGELAGRDEAVCVFLNEDPRPVDGCRPGDGVRLVAQGM